MTSWPPATKALNSGDASCDSSSPGHQHLHRTDPRSLSTGAGPFARHPRGSVGISSITVAELRHGVERSHDPPRNLLALMQFCANWRSPLLTPPRPPPTDRCAPSSKKRAPPLVRSTCLSLPTPWRYRLRWSPTTNVNSAVLPGSTSSIGSQEIHNLSLRNPISPGTTGSLFEWRRGRAGGWLVD